MNRNEKLSHVIGLAQKGASDYTCREGLRELNQFVLDILLAEQKRSEGCLYCNGDMVDGYALENMQGKYPKIVGLSIKNNRCDDQLPISFCPNCGRDLTEGESV